MVSASSVCVDVNLHLQAAEEAHSEPRELTPSLDVSQEALEVTSPTGSKRSAKGEIEVAQSKKRIKAAPEEKTDVVVRRSSRIAKIVPKEPVKEETTKVKGKSKKTLADGDVRNEGAKLNGRATKGDKKARAAKKATSIHSGGEHAPTKKTEGTKRKQSGSATEQRKRARTNTPDNTDGLSGASKAESVANSDQSEGSNKRKRSAESSSADRASSRKRNRAYRSRSAEAALAELP